MAEELVENNNFDRTMEISRASRLRRLSRPILLVLILLVGAIFRFTDLNWDQNRHLHPDERYMTVLASMLKSPASLQAYFDSGKSTLNPFNIDWGKSYVYGTLPLFAGRYLGEFMDQACGDSPQAIPQAVSNLLFASDAHNCRPGTFTGYDDMALLGRLLSGIYDLLAVFILFLIGKRLFGWRTGLLAAAFSTAAVLQIQLGHYFTVDSAANLFVVLTTWFCVLMITDKGPWSFWRTLRLSLYAIGAGISTGCALASKISVWPLVPMIIVALFILFMRDRRSGLSPWLGAAGALILAGIFTFGTFRAAQPYAFVGNSADEFALTLQRCNQLDASDMLAKVCSIGVHLPQPIREIVAPSARWIEQVNLAQGFVNGTVDAPFGDQWANRTPIVFPLVNIIFWGLGIPLGLAACLGFLFCVRQLLRGRRWWAYLIPVLWAGLYFLYQGTQWTKSMRYLLPIYPMLCLCASIGLLALWRRWNIYASGKIRNFTRYGAAALIALILVGTLVWSLAFAQIYSEPITRVTASDWIYSNVPTALGLRWDETSALHLGVKKIDLRPGAAQTYVFSLDKGTSVTQTGLQVTLNQVQGSGRVRVQLMENDGQTPIKIAQGIVDSTHTTINLGNTQLLSGTQYILELMLTTGQNVSSRTSIVANEHWDDALPQNGDGKDAFGSYYSGLTSSSDGQIQNYNEDEPNKLPQVLNWLDEADYLVMSSNRLYASIPRLPWRYPMTTEYYRAMLGGELGFELVADFNSFPRLGPFVFNDQEMPQILRRTANTQGTPVGIYVPYPTAEEAFSVYDHPRVLIFKKTSAYSRSLAEQILGKYDLTRTIRQTPLQAVNTPRGMLMDDQTRLAQQTGGTWSDLFPRASPLNQSQPLAALAWLFFIEILGLAAFPIIALATATPMQKVCQRKSHDTSTPVKFGSQRLTLIDGGYSFSKILALLLVAVTVWWLSSTKLTQYSRLEIWCVVIVLLVFGIIMWVRHWAFLRDTISSHFSIVLISELVFLFGFALFLLIRVGNPDLWHPYMGGEKPMDFAYLNAVLKSTYFPPIDPWFSGGYINYYYFGYVLVGTPIKALGIDPSIAYNLAVPLFYGLTACGAYGLGATFYARLGQHGKSRLKASRVILAGCLAVLFVVVLGNLREVDVLLPAWQQLGGAKNGVPAIPATISGIVKWVQGIPLGIYPNWPYWNPTRPTAGLVVDSVQIAEFPLFTFLYADLHAHMLAMPLAFLSIAFALAFAGKARHWYTIGLGALVVGALWPTNSWDYPVYLLVGLAALLLGILNERSTKISWSDLLQRCLSALPVLVVFAILTRAFYIPYLENYGSAYNSIEPWTNEHTPLGIYLSIYCLFIVPVITYLLLGVWLNHRLSSRRFLAGAAFGLASLFAAIVLAALGIHIAVVALPLATLAFMAALMPGTAPQTRILWLLTAGAFTLTLFVEFFTLRGDIGRMNTVFKFYIQAWLILGVAAGVLTVWVFDRFAELRAQPLPAEPLLHLVIQPAFSIVLAILIFLAALYPIFAIPAKVNDRFVADAPRGLDGMAYMTRAVRYEAIDDKSANFPLMDDMMAIKWMQDHVQGSPTIIEGTTGPNLYRWGNRFSIYTGLPAIVGWQWHQRQQRAALSDQIVYDRDADVTAFYNTTDITQAFMLIRRYDARYIIVGQLEKLYYKEEGLPKFTEMVQRGFIRLVYQNEGTTIYQVNDNVFPPAAVSSSAVSSVVHVP
jgi:YYY domain-containing protein